MEFKDILKYGVLFWFSAVFAILGILLVAFGVVTQIVYDVDHSYIIPVNFFSAPAIIIVIGALIFIMAFLGCCGALKENYRMINLFSYLLLLLFILEVVAGVVCYMKRSEIRTDLKMKLNESMSIYSNNTEVKNTWNVIQHEFACCGVDGPTDWEKINMDIPASCCRVTPLDDNMKPMNCVIVNSFQDGCYHAVLQSLEKKYLILILSAAGISSIQIFMIIFSFKLAKSIREEYTTV